MMFHKIKNNKVLLGIIALVVIFLLVGSYLLFSNKPASQETEENGFIEEELESLTPEEIGLEIVVSSDNKEVKFVINKPEGFTNVEYELSYEANDRANPGNRVTRGVAGEDELTGEIYESEDLFLGTCSSGTCIADTGVNQVDLLLKITKTDGTMYQVEASQEI